MEPITFRKACEYFIQYGNVGGPVDEMVRTWHTVQCTQLRAAADHAKTIKHRPEAEVNSHILALIWGKIE